MFKHLPQRFSWILRLASIGFDLMLAALSFLAAYTTVMGFQQALAVPGIWEKLAAFIAITILSLALFSVTRGSWRYVSIPDLLALIKAVVLAVGAYTIAVFLISRASNVPRSVPVLTALYMIASLSGARLTYRLLMDGGMGQILRRNGPRKASRNILICGLTDDAESFIRTTRRADSPLSVVGILDDNHHNQGRSVQGTKVRGSLADLPTIIAKLADRGIEVTELAVAESQPGRQRLSHILEIATSASLKVTRIQGVTETSSVSTQTLLETKPIEIGDLLGRPEVKTDIESVARLINGRVVLATGAGGSIGSELCRQIAAFSPATLIITDSSEFHLYMLDMELRTKHPKLHIGTRLVNIRDAQRVSNVFDEFHPDVVFHAAALKHVPLVEENPLEAIKTNVIGTRNVADAAMAHETSTFVMISTDKAVNPTNVMGATKRAAEAYCQALDLIAEKTRFKTVRFGNVLGSNGSVVPRFQQQIALGGPVTVTHPHIVRYFMTIPEAVRLVLHASAHALRSQSERGKIMVLDMGKPVRIVDLAERMIQLAGHRPHTEIEIVFTGLRPGEKLYEELFDPSEIQDGRTDEGYVVASPRMIDISLLHRTFSGIEAAIGREDYVRAIELLSHVVPEYKKNVAPIETSSGGEDETEPGWREEEV